MKKRQKAFTLIEVLVAITILIIGIISGFVLVTRALYNVAVIKDRLTASFLAQEGIELTRQIRDSNFLRILNNEESADWRDGLADGTYIIESKVDSEGSIELAEEDQDRIFFYNETLRIYNYDNNGEPTTFNRKIKITTIPDSDDEIRVESIMQWKTRTIDFDLTVEDHLYNWMKL